MAYTLSNYIFHARCNLTNYLLFIIYVLIILLYTLELVPSVQRLRASRNIHHLVALLKRYHF